MIESRSTVSRFVESWSLMSDGVAMMEVWEVNWKLVNSFCNCITYRKRGWDERSESSAVISPSFLLETGFGSCYRLKFIKGRSIH